jgi:hypothetical protein
MAQRMPSGMKIANYGLFTFLVALPAMILLYKGVVWYLS